MRRAASWSIDGIEPDIREAAKEAARRQGQSLGEWLNDIIADQAAELEIGVDEMDSNDRLEAVAARLHQLDRHDDRRFRKGGRDPRDGADFRPRFGRSATPRTYERPREQRGHMRIQDAEALLDAAIEAFDERASKSQRQTAQSVDAVKRLIKTQARRRDDSLEVLSDISNRLSDIETHMTQERLEAERDSLNKKPRPSGPDEAGLRRLENKLDTLLRNSAQAAPSPTQPRAKADWRDSPEAAVLEIGRQQRFLNGEARDWRTARRLADEPVIPARVKKAAAASRGGEPHSLQSDIASLGVKLEAIRLQDLAKDLTRLRTEMDTMSAGLAELAPRDAVTSIESAIQNLTKRIEASREEGMRETLLKPIVEIADDMRHSLGAIGTQPSIEGIEREIKKIGERLEALSRPQEPATLTRLQEQTQEIHHLLTAAAAYPERPQSYPHPSLGPSEEDFVSQRLQQTHVDSLAKIEGKLNDLAQKVERAMTPEPSAASAAMDTGSLEALIKALGDQFAAAQEPYAGRGAFEALQSQIAELAQRLERTDSRFSALNTLQSSVGELFTQLDKTRFAANDAAEIAARKAAREAVREVMEQTGLLNNNLPREPDITREIADLRLVQDEADRQTHSTLNAVHETLEKIVNRLAMLEEEIGEAQETSAASLRLAERTANLERHREAGAAVQAKQSEPLQKKREPHLASEMPRARPRPEEPPEILIEPGALFPKNKDALVSSDPSLPLGERALDGVPAEPVRSRADFIAAARRAAQAAQADQGQREMARPRIPMVEAAETETHAGLIEQTWDFLSNHKRQLTLSIAALFLAAGTYAVVKTMSHSKADVSLNTPGSAIHSRADQRTGPTADTRTAAPETETAAMPPRAMQEPSRAMQDKAAPRDGDIYAKPGMPAARSEVAPANLPVMATITSPSAQKTIAGSDPIVTGSIVAPKTAAESTAALAALREQAEAGNANAQYDLATRYAEGRSMARDFKLAADWYEKAAARGLAPAAYRLGSLYEKGLGVSRDFARAKMLYQKAADLGHSHAMHNLAVLIAEGGDGKPDYATAAIWFRKAAEYGIRDSQYNLAILYARGLGVPQDLVQSYTWFAIAAAQGDEDASKKRDDVATRLDAKSLAMAKAAADSFHPREPDRAANEVQIPPGGWEASAPMPVAPKTSSGSKAKISRL